MSDNELDYAEIRRNVEQGLQRQKRGARIGTFVANLIMYIVFMALCWGIALTNSALPQSDQLMTLLLLPTIGWGLGLFFHLMTILMDSGVMDKSMRERIVLREMGEELMRKGLADMDDAEKPKRRLAQSDADLVRLSDDGELVPLKKAEQQSRDQSSST